MNAKPDSKVIEKLPPGTVIDATDRLEHVIRTMSLAHDLLKNSGFTDRAPSHDTVAADEGLHELTVRLARLIDDMYDRRKHLMNHISE